MADAALANGRTWRFRPGATRRACPWGGAGGRNRTGI